MLETALAVFFITAIFLIVFQVAHMVTVKIIVDHAAMRAARAKAVGFNDWMCLKSARVAAIPVSGRCIWPADDDPFDEAARVPTYLSSETEGRANGILDYERWHSMGFDVRSSAGFSPEVRAGVSIAVPRFCSRGEDDGDAIRVSGEARVESHYPFYMNDQGR